MYKYAISFQTIKHIGILDIEKNEVKIRQQRLMEILFFFPAYFIAFGIFHSIQMKSRTFFFFSFCRL